MRTGILLAPVPVALLLALAPQTPVVPVAPIAPVAPVTPVAPEEAAEVEPWPGALEEGIARLVESLEDRNELFLVTGEAPGNEGGAESEREEHRIDRRLLVRDTTLRR